MDWHYPDGVRRGWTALVRDWPHLEKSPPKKFHRDRELALRRLHASAPTHTQTTQHGRRSTTAAASEAAERPLCAYFGAKILEFVHVGTATRPFAALVARHPHLDTAAATLEPANRSAGSFRSHYGITCADLLLQDSESRQDHLAIWRR
jgi:hypothetical protein